MVQWRAHSSYRGEGGSISRPWATGGLQAAEASGSRGVRAEEWAARGGGQRAAGGSAVTGESCGRESASGVAPTDAVTPSPLSAPAYMCVAEWITWRVGWRVASHTPWRQSLARSLAHSVASEAPLSSV